ncbi:MAG: hypothetical protein LBF66_02895 [Holosporales bacterium]|nr:hypothetical protein [Holosporales bacterium]
MRTQSLVISGLVPRSVSREPYMCFPHLVNIHQSNHSSADSAFDRCIRRTSIQIRTVPISIKRLYKI